VETSTRGEAHPHPSVTPEVDHTLRADMTSVVCEAINLTSNLNIYIVNSSFKLRGECERCRTRDLI
jgi:hypothetical protein